MIEKEISLTSGDTTIFTYTNPIFIINLYGLVTTSVQNSDCYITIKVQNDSLSDLSLNSSTNFSNRQQNCVFKIPFSSSTAIAISANYASLSAESKHYITYPTTQGIIKATITSNVTGKLKFIMKYLSEEGRCVS